MSSPHDSRPRLPVTLISGFAGAGKTSLIRQLLRQAGDRRVAVIVNDQVVEDLSQLERAGSALKATPSADTGGLIGLAQGCLCCSLRTELIEAVERLAAEGRHDYLLIESSGASAPQPLAELFTFTDERGDGLCDIAQLDTLVTVVDAEAFLDDWQSEDELSDRQLPLEHDEQRSVSDLLAEQIEFANVIVLSKLDRVSAEDASLIEALLRQLNPEARLLRAEHGAVPAEAVLGTQAFDFEDTEQAAGWIAALRDEPVPPDEEHGLSSFVYRARVPFHPQRLWSLIGDGDTWEGVLRSKGFFWLASRMAVTGLWSHAGGSAACEGAGQWYAELPESEWPEDEDDRAQIREDFAEPWGDRRQELAFLGADLDEERLRELLDAALLSEDELALGPDAWARWEDPFPDWSGHAPAADA
jgi:G3E family GTPase